MNDILGDLRSETPATRLRAAIRIGYEKPRGAVAALVDQLSKEADQEVFCACCAALELLGDGSAVAGLVFLLERCHYENLWSVTHALRVLTGVDPLVPLHVDPPEKRRRWLEALQRHCGSNRRGGDTSAIEPTVADVHADAEFVRFGIDNGRSRICIDYKAPEPDCERWVRWSRTLFVAGKPFHGVGSTCSTCETVMGHLGWPQERAVTVSRLMSDRLRAGADLTPDLIRQWSPLLGELPSGNYLAASMSLRVEHVSEEKYSWWYLREYDRDKFSEPYPFHDHYAHHYQGPNFPFDEVGKTYWMVMPSQDPETLDNACVDGYVDLIRAGGRPTVLALGWRDQRYTRAEWPECFVILCVLDGHHKLEAYARCRQPAPIIGLFRLEDSWGDPQDRSRELVENLRQQRSEVGKMATEDYWRHVAWLD